MANINFDPELMRNIRIIYGNSNLDERTLQNIYETWQKNPQIIRNAARQRLNSTQQSSSVKQFISPVPSIPWLNQVEIAQDDLRGIQSFGVAFNEARKRGLKKFLWGKGVYGTELAKKKKELPQNKDEQKKQKATVEVGEPQMNNPFVVYSENMNDAIVAQNKFYNDGEFKDKVYNTYKRPPTTNMYGQKLTTEQLNSQKWQHIPYRTKVKYQQGGTMNNQQELQKAFMAYLIQDAQTQGIQIQSEQDLQAYAEQLGEEGIKAKYQEFMQKMQGGVMARLGAKLQYYKKLKGVCPEGEELVYFKQGGRICKACQKAQKGTSGLKENEVDKFKKGRQQFRKNMKSTKDEASRDSIAINKYNDQETMANKGHKGSFKNNKWVPDRKQYAKKDACGSKMKKR